MKNGKLDFIKIQSFYLAKDTVKRIKTEATYREDIFANYILDKGLASPVFKEFTKLNSKKQNQIKTCAKDMMIHLTNKDIQMTNKDKKVVQQSLAFRKNGNLNHGEILLNIQGLSQSIKM